LHRFDTAHESERQTDGQTDRRPDDGKDARSILLSRVKKEITAALWDNLAKEFVFYVGVIYTIE